jgi:hypothetical protein
MLKLELKFGFISVKPNKKQIKIKTKIKIRMFSRILADISKRAGIAEKFLITNLSSFLSYRVTDTSEIEVGRGNVFNMDKGRKEEFEK